jgi:hypothetical protein
MRLEICLLEEYSFGYSSLQIEAVVTLVGKSRERYLYSFYNVRRSIIFRRGKFIPQVSGMRYFFNYVKAIF